ncbi:MAG: hypothetical protein M3304_09225 [Actinomycetota bacterium]|jgi:hypothetical protein|nr:hypothetical protein [Actinomycetota bacterium]
MISIATISAAGARSAGLVGLDERIGVRLLAPPPLHRGCAPPVGEER